MSLEEVARRARVSTATVSRVLNDVDVVKSSTRARVLKAVADLKYHPNLHARSLAGGKSRTIGMIVSNMENPFFIDIYRGLDAGARAHGYEVVIANTDYRPERLVSAIRTMLGRRVAGLAVIVSEMDPTLSEELMDASIPIVFYDVGAARKNITNIRVHYDRGVEKVVEYLYSLGHRSMAFVGHHSRLGPTGERRKAFLRSVARYGDDVEVRTVATADALDGGRQAVRELWASGFQPTALICVNDLMAAGALRELHDAGRLVPQHVSVTGFDNIRLSEFCVPALTTLHIPRERIGQIAFECLVPDADRPVQQGREIVIDPELMVRESTGPAPRG